jgi:FtsH-binding integral membrane protein
MAVIDQDQRYARMLRAQQAEQQRDRDERQQLWAFVWILFGFKFLTMALLIFWIEWEQVLYIAAMTSWWWLVVPAVALSGPIMNRLRMRRMRRKRAALRSAEFSERSARGSGNDVVFSLIEEPGSFGIVRDERGSRPDPDGHQP